MGNPKPLWGTLVILGWLVFTCGCGDDRPEGMPDLYPVTLEFTQDGSPLAGASVRLVPDDSSNRWVSGGSTDTSGKAELRTHAKFDGVPAGKYKLCVTKTETQGEAAPVDMMNLPSEEAEKASAVKVISLVDPQYAVPTKTPLEIEVSAGGNSYEPFDLGKPVTIEQEGPKF